MRVVPGVIGTGTELLSSGLCVLSHCSQGLEAGGCSVAHLPLATALAPMWEVDRGGGGRGHTTKVGRGIGETSGVIGFF